MSAQNTLSETAARWFIRMRDAAQDAPERNQFESWLMSNPAHQAEYESIAETIQQLAANDTLESLAEALESKKYFQKSARTKKIKNVIAGAVATFAVGLTALFSVQQYQTWYAQPVLQLAANNPVGKITSQTLADGSQVTLSANSDMQITFYRNQRHIQLNRGEAIFQVAKDEKRPFVVQTQLTNSSMAKITVLGTHFVVNKLSKLVRISVNHGKVQVENIGLQPAPVLVLQAGQVAEILPKQAPFAVKRNAADAFSFAQGKLVFAGADAQEIADTLSRYRPIPVRVSGKSKRNISAVINTREAEQFLQGLPNIAPVQIINQPQQTVILQK